MALTTVGSHDRRFAYYIFFTAQGQRFAWLPGQSRAWVIWMHGQTPLHFFRRGQHTPLPQPPAHARTIAPGEASQLRSLAGARAPHKEGVRRRIDQRQGRPRLLVDVSYPSAESARRL